jgi:lambda family phage portal protein
MTGTALAKPRIRVRSDGSVPLRQAFFGWGDTGFSSRRDAGRSDIPETNGWRPPPGFAGNNAWGERETILGRARDLDKNNGWINGGLDRRVESVIGGSIRLSAQPAIELLNRDFEWRMKWTGDVQARFKVWGNDIARRCDARMQLTFGQLVRLAYLTYIRDGECAAEIRDAKRGLTNTTNVLLFEPERISTPSDRMATEGPQLRNGVAFDANGAAMGYWVQSRHPSDWAGLPVLNQWEFIPRFGKTGRHKMLHVFSPRYAEQNRGISRLAEAMVPARMMDRLDRAEVQAALKSAVLSFWIKSPGTAAELEEALAPPGNPADADRYAWIDDYLDYRSEHPVRMDGAQITHLLPDEDVVTPERTSPNSNYPLFARFVLQKIAGSLGISYPQLSQDWSGINYSSARALLNELWRSFLEDRQFFTQQFCTPIYAAWLEVEVANGDVKVPGGPLNFYRQKTALTMAEWIGPGRGSVDPLKEANAANLDTAAGRTSTVAQILESGRDPSDVLAEETWYLQERERRGLAEPNHNLKPATPDAEASTAAGDAAMGGSATGGQQDGGGA